MLVATMQVMVISPALPVALSNDKGKTRVEVDDVLVGASEDCDCSREEDQEAITPEDVTVRVSKVVGPTVKFSRAVCDGVDSVTASKLLWVVVLKHGEPRSAVVCVTVIPVSFAERLLKGEL